MSDQNVFKQTDTSTQTTNVQSDDLATKLATIKNEHGAPKYADVNTALEALAHSQTFIPELKTQLDAKDNELLSLRTELAKQQGIQEAMERFGTAPTGTQETPSATPVEQTIEEKVLAIINQQNAVASQSENFKLVNSTLAQTYGDKVKDVVTQKAADLGTTPEALQEMSKDNPKLVLSLFNTKSVSTPNTLGSNIQTQLTPTPKESLSRPEKSMLMGAKTSEVNDFMARVKAEVYEKYGVQS